MQNRCTLQKKAKKTASFKQNNYLCINNNAGHIMCHVLSINIFLF